jgi:kumamolisin
LQAIGFLNPILYKASAAENKEIFTDITSGKNGAYTATTGWDAVTGLGSMKGYAMFQFLLNR